MIWFCALSYRKVSNVIVCAYHPDNRVKLGTDFSRRFSYLVPWPTRFSFTIITTRPRRGFFRLFGLLCHLHDREIDYVKYYKSTAYRGTGRYIGGRGCVLAGGFLFLFVHCFRYAGRSARAPGRVESFLYTDTRVRACVGRWRRVEFC